MSNAEIIASIANGYIRFRAFDTKAKELLIEITPRGYEWMQRLRESLG